MTHWLCKKCKAINPILSFICHHCGSSASQDFIVAKQQYDLRNSALNKYADAKAELSDINSDGPELSCPYIDGVIKKYPDTATTLEYVRTINSQLRYDRNGYAEMYNEIKKEIDELKLKLAVAKKALIYCTYDSINWWPEMENKEDLCLTIKNFDEIAREALKEIE